MKNSVKLIITGMVLLMSVVFYYAKDLNSKMIKNPLLSKEKPFQTTNLKGVYDNYFSLKNALTETDVVKATSAASKLRKAISAVKIEKLTSDEQIAWMSTKGDLTAHAGHIESLKTIEEKRLHFSFLTQSMYKLMKVSKRDRPVYYQFCPMYNNEQGGYWLSKESNIQNPYYGKEMMTCGSTVETLK